jgi:hypothetical protein
MEDRQTHKDQFLRDSYEIGERRIEALQSWITAAISQPAMSREHRLQGLEIIEERSPSQFLRIAVERICPSQSVEQGQELEIQR